MKRLSSGTARFTARLGKLSPPSRPLAAAAPLPLPAALEADVRRLLVGLLLADLEANPVSMQPTEGPTDGTPPGHVGNGARL